jgi:hypothetical protein
MGSDYTLNDRRGTRSDPGHPPPFPSCLVRAVLVSLGTQHQGTVVERELYEELASTLRITCTAGLLLNVSVITRTGVPADTQASPQLRGVASLG